MEMSGKLLYARTSAPVYIAGGFGNPNRGNVRHIPEEDRKRRAEREAQYQKEVRRQNTGYVKKANVHDRLTGKAPIAFVPKK